jgi:hypothetical protein
MSILEKARLDDSTKECELVLLWWLMILLPAQFSDTYKHVRISICLFLYVCQGGLNTRAR